LLPSVASFNDSRVSSIDGTTDSVRSFYDKIGWQEDEEGNFEDALRFEDLRPVSADYIKNCHLRVRDAIEPSGHFLLDVASGPVQYDDYLMYHEGYQQRVCVDISISALKAARAKLGRKGVYILGDITELPFKDEVFDAVVSLHTIYHVPFERQPLAFEEIHRTLKVGRTAVVVYSWGEHSVFRIFPRIPWRAVSSLRNRLSILLRGRYIGEGSADTSQVLYSYQAGPKWFLRQNWPFSFELKPWRSVDVELMKAVIKPWACGRLLLKVLFAIENRFPEKIALLGQYPLIKIRK
tara:strand:+ start:16276 stop:17157 length:882 start_codon:yes stop_codon:yes gene_type:complete